MKSLVALAGSLALSACTVSLDPSAQAQQTESAAPRASSDASAPMQPAVAESATKVQPILLGSRLPEANMSSLSGEPTTLAAATGGAPAVLVFYRGGWCPYCNVQLSGLRLIREPLQALGYQLIAISPDRPEALRESLANTELDYTLLSDAKAEAMTSFGLAFRVDAKTQELYRGYGIDLAAASGEDHGLLPVPAVFIVDSEGVLQFSYVHPDYKVRLPEAAILAAAEAIASQRHKVKPAR